LTIFLFFYTGNISSTAKKHLDRECHILYQGYIVPYEDGDKITCLKNDRGNLVFGSCTVEYKYCADGSIRRIAYYERDREDYCIRNEKNLKQDACDFFETDEGKQKWSINFLGDKYSETGVSDIDHQIVSIGNTIQTCLMKTTINNVETMTTTICNTEEKNQKFYFRSRGELLKQGKIYHRLSNSCLIPEKSEFSDCTIDSEIKYYENGEILKDGKCLDYGPYSSNNNVIHLDTCNFSMKQKWDMNCNKYGSCLIRNMGKSQCLRYSGVTLLYTCSDNGDKIFDIVNGNWDTSKSEWVKLGCNQDGKISVEIQNEISLGVTESNTESVEVVLAGETPFMAVGVSTSLSMEKTWEENFGSSVKSIMSCENYENSFIDKVKFTHGCIWQLKMTTFNRELGKLLKWRPPIVKCTHSGEHPKCNVFMKCKNKLCDECIPEEQPTEKSIVPEASKNKKTKNI